MRYKSRHNHQHEKTKEPETLIYFFYKETQNHPIMNKETLIYFFKQKPIILDILKKKIYFNLLCVPVWNKLWADDNNNICNKI